MAKTKGQEESALKKIVIYAVLTAAALLFPARSVQLGKMKPVELIILRENAGEIELITDTGDSGTGGSVPAALRVLKETSSGNVYLDTAVYLLASKDAEMHISELKPYLKGKTLVAQVDGKVDAEKLAEYLAVHRPSVRLKDWTEGCRLETVRKENEKWIIEEKDEKMLDKG